MTMKRLTVRSRVRLFGTAALCLASVLRVSAQTTAPAAGQKSDESEETLVLSPFVVDASEDADGYAAKSTLAGTRVRTDLKDVASAISVVTQQFLQDTGARKSEDLLVYTTNTEVGGVRGNFSGAGGGDEVLLGRVEVVSHGRAHLHTCADGCPPAAVASRHPRLGGGGRARGHRAGAPRAPGCSAAAA